MCIVVDEGMGKSVLAVTDLSTAGDVALVEAHRQARELNATLCVVHSVPHLDAIRPLFPQQLADEIVMVAELPRIAEAALRSRLEALGIDATAVEVGVEQGTTAEGAILAIERWQPMLVVIGSPEGMVDAERVIRYTTTPVLVARPSPQTGVVLSGTDLSDPSLPAIRAAAEASERLGGELVVAHAIEVNPLSIYGVDLPAMFNSSKPSELHEAAQGRLDRAVNELGVRAKTTISVGSPSAALVELAKVEQAQLLVIGTHGRTGLTRFVLGSVAESVIRRAPCSVLVVREQ